MENFIFLMIFEMGKSIFQKMILCELLHMFFPKSLIFFSLQKNGEVLYASLLIEDSLKEEEDILTES